MRSVFISVILAILAGGSLLFFSLSSNDRAAHAAKRVNETLQLIDTLDAVKIALLDAETGARGFLLTRNESYLAPYRGAAERADAAFKGLSAFAGLDTADRAALERIDVLIKSKLSVTAEIIGTARTGNWTTALTLFMKGTSKSVMDQFRGEIDTLRAAKHTLVRTQADELTESHRWARLNILIAMGVAVGGIFVAIVMLSRIVKAREHTLKDLDRASENLRLATVAAHLGHYQFSAESDHVTIDGIAREILGLDTNTPTVAAWTALIHDDDRERVLSRIGEAKIGEAEYVVDYRVVRPNQEIRYVKAAARIERDGRGRLFAGHGLIQDETEIRLAEIRDRAARKQAEDMSLAKSQFLANMSHEIRTPLNGVMGMLTLLLHTPLTPAQKNLIETASSSAESLLGVISDILDMAKIETGKMTLDADPFSLRDMVESTVALLGNIANAKQIELACRIDPALPDRLIGDSNRIRQVLINLLGNAVKFTSEGQVAVEITQGAAEGGAEAADDIHLQFAIQDTGIGIAADRQKAIFDAFTQADGTTTRKFGGTGLGLTICAQLVELMHGRIWLTSRPGEGSTFFFSVALALDRNTQVLEAPSLANLQMLVVDDNATMRHILDEILKSWRVEVAVAESGTEALRLCESFAAEGRQFDLIVTDFKMPEMDGPALARRIKGRSPSCLKTRPLFLSAR